MVLLSYYFLSLWEECPVELVQMECQDYHIYKLEFWEKVENHLLTIRVEFTEHWRLTSKNEDLLNNFGNTVCFAIVGDRTEFPYDPKKNLVSIPIHIPNPYGRQLFKACMDFYIKESSAPMHTAFIDHPGYPELVVTYDTKVLTEELVNRLIVSITEGIRLSRTEKELIETEVPDVDEDTLDEIDEDVVVEFEFDDELKNIMKEPVSNLVLPIGGGMEDA
jgi:hypothetical protein